MAANDCTCHTSGTPGGPPGQDHCEPEQGTDEHTEWLNGPKTDFAYEVRLLRDDDISPRPDPRKDVIVDARGGFLESTADLLRRIEVYYGDYDETANEVSRTSRTVWDQLVRRYDLHYIEGAFGKTLLGSIDQIGRNGTVYATNRFEYFDDVRYRSAYHGFDEPEPWDPGDDDVTPTLLTDVETSVLGASDTISGDGHLYLGFNPTDWKKTGSFGGALTITAGTTEALAEFIDLNGDGLADKVFRDGRGGDVMFRINESGGDTRTPTFSDPPRPVRQLGDLSSEFNVGVEGSLEAYQGGGGVQFGVSGDVSVGTDYFIDANDDGLADFVTDGDVLFNRLEVDDQGVAWPTFADSSEGTKVPVEPGKRLELNDIRKLSELEELQRKQSTLVDTIRRWKVPFSGVVRITGNVMFDPPVDTRTPPVDGYDGDGVRVAIERGGHRAWSAVLAQPGESATPSFPDSHGDPTDVLRVDRGQSVLFRLQSVDNGFRDQVRWDPRIEYVSIDGETDAVPSDVNGLSQTVYQASEDFTLAGRPGTLVSMPLRGTVHFETRFTKSKPTSDDLAVVVLKNGQEVFRREYAWSETTTTDELLTADIPVAAPTASAADQLEVKVAVSSPIDIKAIDWKPRLYYTEAFFGRETVPVVHPVTGKRTLELTTPADIDIYPERPGAGPVRPWTANVPTGNYDVQARVEVLGGQQGGTATLTVKQRGEKVAKSFDFVIPDHEVASAGETTLTGVPLVNGEEYWFDVTLHDAPCTAPAKCKEPMTDQQIASTVQVVGGTPLPHNRYSAGHQAVFPISYRGWGTAGYRADGRE